MKPSIENGIEGAWIQGVWHPNDYSSETHISKTIKEKWFVYSSDGQVDFYPTEQLAHERFLKLIAEERSIAQDEGEWNLEVEDTCWGKVYQDVILRKVANPFNMDIEPDDENYSTEEYWDAFANERRKLP